MVDEWSKFEVEETTVAISVSGSDWWAMFEESSTIRVPLYSCGA